MVRPVAHLCLLPLCVHRQRLLSLLYPCITFLHVLINVAAVEAAGHEDLTRIIRRHVFVGVVNDTTSLIQHDTRLYLVNHLSLRWDCAPHVWRCGFPVSPSAEPLSLPPAGLSMNTMGRATIQWQCMLLPTIIGIFLVQHRVVACGVGWGGMHTLRPACPHPLVVPCLTMLVQLGAVLPANPATVFELPPLLLGAGTQRGGPGTAWHGGVTLQIQAAFGGEAGVCSGGWMALVLCVSVVLACPVHASPFPSQLGTVPKGLPPPRSMSCPWCTSVRPPSSPSGMLRHHHSPPPPPHCVPSSVIPYQDVAALLLDKGAMLDEYFSIGIADMGEEGGGVRLTCLPRLQDGHTPFLGALPYFLLALAWQVNWTEEQPCFDSIARCLAEFYAQLPPEAPPAPAQGDGVVDGGGSGSGGGGAGAAPSSRLPSARARIISTVLSPGFRANLTPSCSLIEKKQVVQVCACAVL